MRLGELEAVDLEFLAVPSLLTARRLWSERKDLRTRIFILGVELLSISRNSTTRIRELGGKKKIAKCRH